jgi:hypothetical protein
LEERERSRSQCDSVSEKGLRISRELAANELAAEKGSDHHRESDQMPAQAGKNAAVGL